MRTVSPDVVGPPVQILESSRLIVREYVRAAFYALAAILVVRSRQVLRGTHDPRVESPAVRKLLWATSICTGVVVFLGTIVTAAGPHARVRERAKNHGLVLLLRALTR